MTNEEKKLWYCFLEKHQFRFLKQKVIDNYIIDFYRSKARLAIEVDGSHHYTEDGIKYDSIRTETLCSYGVKVIRFRNNDINTRFKDICNMINEELKGEFK